MTRLLVPGFAGMAAPPAAARHVWAMSSAAVLVLVAPTASTPLG